jgi:hypothetical protein
MSRGSSSYTKPSVDETPRCDGASGEFMSTICGVESVDMTIMCANRVVLS